MSSTKSDTVNMAAALLAPALGRGQEGDPAILYGESVLSYGELNTAANKAGNVFRGLGVECGDRVLMMVRDTPDFVIVYLGLLKIAAVPVGLSTRLVPQDTAYTIDDSESGYFVLDSFFKDHFKEALTLTENRPKIIYTDAEGSGDDYLQSLMEDASDELEAVQLPWDAPALWMYSSGTTGKPKGVVHQQKTILAAARLMGEILEVGPGDRIYGTSKLFFAFSLAHCLFGSLYQGAATILDSGWPDSDIVASNVEKYEPTIVLSVPTFYRNLLRDGSAQKPAFKNVRYYLTAGEKMPESLFDQWMDATGRPALEGIGATETCFLFLANRPDHLKPGTCGVPTPGTEVKIISQNGEDVHEPGVPGVLWVKMDSVAGGYWKLDERTREVFQDGWYCTNDMFVMDADGMYEHQGRADDMLKISGQWVSPAEIEEEVLLNTRVLEAAVVGIPNEDGLVRLALFLVAPDVTEDKEAFEKELQDALIEKLSIYKCPRQIYYVDAMPLTATGKLQRFALRDSVMGDAP